VKKCEVIAQRIRDLGCVDGDVVGQLGVDLGDLYAGVERCKLLIELLLTTPVDQRDRVAEVLAELSVELRHIDYHAKSSLGMVDTLADEVDP